MDYKIFVLCVCLLMGNAIAACVDTDGGNNKFLKGHCSDGHDDFDDECVGDTYIEEIVCEDNLCVVVEDLSCPSGSHCIDGACVGQNVPPPSASCTDSDSGINKVVYGECLDDVGLYMDECLNENSIKEFYCQNGRCSIEADTVCPLTTECEEGKCVPMASSTGSSFECVDSDNGDNRFVSGTCTDQWHGTAYDTCLSQNKIRELICVDNACAPSANDLCGAGTVCLEGRCVRTSTETNNGATNNNGDNPVAVVGSNQQGFGGQIQPLASSSSGGAPFDPVLLVVIIVIIVVVASVVIIVVMVAGKR